MRGVAGTLALVVLLLPCGRAHGEGARPARSKVLEAALEKAIATASPSIACIYVSRSDAYHKAPHWGVAPPEDAPGQLGRFDAAAAALKVPARARNRARILRTIRDHDLSNPATVPESYGSGIVVADTGLVLTNAHVVRDATKLYVRLSGRRGSWADIHASDPRSDLAVLHLLDKVADLKAIKLGDAGKVRKGQFVVALSNEFAPGFRDGEPTASCGIVSALRRRPPGELDEKDLSKVPLYHYGTLIQTDGRISPGCSGGALLGLDGEVFGLTTVLAGIRGTDSPGAQAIPLDAETRRIVEVLKRGEEVEYGFLGVSLVGRDKWPGRGAKINRALPGWPAEVAGLRGGDVIVSVNGKPVRENDDLFLLIGLCLVGGTARVEVERRGDENRTYNVKLAKFNVQGPIVAARRPPARGGLRVDYTSILAQRPFALRERRPPAGVIVREVVPNSPADKALLQPDKIITHVNGKPVPTPATYYAEMAKATGRATLTILDSEGRPERVSLDLK